jgi:hypothetical protein
MDNVQKNAITDYNSPSSEPFRLQLVSGLQSSIVFLFNLKYYLRANLMISCLRRSKHAVSHQRQKKLNSALKF